MSLLLVTIGLACSFALLAPVAARLVLWIHAPEQGSNDHLRQWILEHGSLDSYPL